MKRHIDTDLLDPTSILSPDIFIEEVLSWLSPTVLCQCKLVSQQWCQFADSIWLWNKLCKKLWKDKVYVPKKFFDLCHNGSPKFAYFESIRDANRCWITQDELCLFQWNFRFKAVAGPNWLEWDQWWNNQPATRITFFPDGTMKRDPESPYPTNTFRWSLSDQSCAKTGPLGSFVSVNNFPKYHVSRYKNWGFLMQSCWALFTSFPMVPKGQNMELEDENLEILNVTFDMQQSEALSYNTGFANLLEEDNTLLLGVLRLIARGLYEVVDRDEEDMDDSNDEEWNGS